MENELCETQVIYKTHSKRTEFPDEILKQIGKTSYYCDICKNGNLTTHKHVHTEEKLYHCDICGKSFSTGELTSHKHTHTGGKPYLCDICDKSFSGKGGLTRHKLIHMEEKQC
ncbi:zinc finger protein 708-like [Octopus sinensis]|uniref:Zinc finger protein 708-like n=1 Tax=Octopus sinensis TaxID=2607531 RepID=A0A6P7TS05_9MOLL|nr:zinc finger protein 708-like [Octopus sinensis]